MDITAPETLAGNLDGSAPAPNGLSLYTNSFRDLTALLANPNSNLASDISNAVSGKLTGLVFNGKPADLINNVVQASLQVEASRQSESQVVEREEKEKTVKNNDDLLKHAVQQKDNAGSTGLADLLSGGISPMEAAVPGSASVIKEPDAKEESSSLKGATEIASIGAAIGQFNKADIENVPTAHLGTGTPASNSPAVATTPGTVLAI